MPEKTYKIGITLVIASIIAIAIFSFRQTRKVNDVSARIDYTRSVLLQLSDLYNTIIGHAGAARNYSLNGQDETIKEMQLTASDLQSKLKQLKSFLKKNPDQQIQADSLTKYINKRIDFSNQLITEGKENGSAAAAALYQTGTGRDYNNQVLSIIQKMQTDEFSTLQLDEQKNAGSIKQLSNYLLGLLLFILALTIILVQKSQLDIAARKRTAEQLKKFNEVLEEQVKVKTTGIRESEEKLQEADKNLRQVLASTVENFYVIDKTYHITLINKAAQRNLMTAWGIPVTVGTYILDGIPDEADEPIRNSFKKVFAGDKVEYELHNSIGGLPAWVLVSYIPVSDENGTIIGANVVTKDITERKKAEEEKEHAHYLLNERVKELTTLHRTSQILQADAKSSETVLQEFVSVLPAGWQYPDITAARIMLGESEFTTSNYSSGFHTQSAGFQTPDGTTGIVEVVYLEEKPAESEGPFLTEERNLINMLTEMLRIYFVRKGASEQILKEKNLSDSVINSMPGVFYFYDHTGKFIRWNKRFETVTGYSGEEISKMHSLDFFEGGDKEHIKNRFGEVFEKGVSNAEVFFLTKDKIKIPYYLTGASIEIDGVPFLLGTGIDITERKKAEEELRISQENLKKSYEEIRQLASNIENIREEEKIKIAREIHDELGQQLTGLKMDVSWLSKKINPQETILREKTKEILLLLDETVKSVRRIASELRPGLLDDLGLSAAIEWQSEEFEKRSGIKIHFKHSIKDEMIPTRLSTGLFRIFQESLTNVARHAKAQEITASLYQSNGEVVLKISDNGNGFDSKEIENKKTLGLLGMKERAMMMGGKYEIVSEPGKGTTVVVSVSLTGDNDQNILNKKASLNN